MNSRIIRTAVLSALLAALAATSQTWASDKTPMKNGPAMTSGQAKALIATAESAKDHRKLAQYFTQKAVEHETDAIDHDAMIEAYRNSKNPTPWATKRPGGVGTIEHCQFIARSDREMAQALREMAAGHEEMAVKAGK